MAAYVFVHFIGEQKDGEQIYFSVSKDGLHWKDLNQGKPVLFSKTGMKGVRDPFLVRHPKTGMYYMIATDLRIEAGYGWEKAQYEGSRDLIIWESEDLVHWSKEWSYTVGVEGAGCVWAPETVYDEETDEFFIFFASMVKMEGDNAPKQRIYSVRTKDFKSFTKAKLFMEKENHVIDSTILVQDGAYYRITKDETTKNIIIEASDTLEGTYKEIDSPVLKDLLGVEGPEGYRLPDGSWCLIVDQFAKGLGYLPMITKDLSSGDFRILSPEEYDLGETTKRHGGVLQIEDETYERLLDYFGYPQPVLEGLYADPDLYYEDGTWYLYPTTDGFTGWAGTQFFVFTSKDGKSFKKENLIVDVASEQVPWATGYAWAPCIAKKDGTYYFYFCAKDKTEKSCIGVAVAETPTGPFKAMEEPMLTMEMMEQYGIQMSQTIDPSIYQEDGKAYIVFGNGAAAIAELTDDMCQVKPETLKNIEGLEDFRESLIITKHDGSYHFTWSCDDTGSEDYHVNYGTADSLYGPVTFEKTLLSKNPDQNVLGTGHHSILYVEELDKYVMAYHRFATPLDKYPEGKGYHREVCIAPLTFDKNGKMVNVFVR